MQRCGGNEVGVLQNRHICRVTPFSQKGITARRLRPCHAGQTQTEQQKQPAKREQKQRKAFGELLIETNDPNSLEQPSEQDFWNGDQWNIIGKTAGFFFPVVAVLILLTGLFAAGNYNSGATSAIKPPTSANETAKIVPLPGTEDN